MTASNSIRCPDRDDLATAWSVVRRHLPATPLVSTALAQGALLKLETFQPTGSFKVRGGLSGLSALPADVEAITASAGNHALGVAYAAKQLGRSATVVLPKNASMAKVAALRDFPVELVQEGSDIDAAEAHALELAGSRYHFLSAYNDAQVIAGQSTLGRELDDQVDGPMTVVCGVGGGGLCAGLGLWAEGRDDVTVIGVESARSRAMTAAIEAGQVVTIDVGDTLADGLAGNLAGDCVTPAIIARTVDRLVAVEDDAIRDAIVWLYRNHGLVVEASGAVGVAAVLRGQIPITGTLVVVLSGRNIAVDKFAALLAGSMTDAAGGQADD